MQVGRMILSLNENNKKSKREKLQYGRPLKSHEHNILGNGIFDHQSSFRTEF